MKKNKLIIIILCILFVVFLIISLISIIYKNNPGKPRDDIFETYTIENLDEKMNNLGFGLQDKIGINYDISSYNAEIVDNKLSVTFIIDGSEEKRYVYDDFVKPTSITMNIMEEKIYLYVLVEDGRVYSIDFNKQSIVEDPEYKGDIESLNVTNAVGINSLDSFDINENPIDKPCVYIKTIEDKYLTDEILIENQNGLIELVNLE